MIALYSINLRIMGRPNIALLGETTVLTPFEALGLPVPVAAAARAAGGGGGCARPCWCASCSARSGSRCAPPASTRAWPRRRASGSGAMTCLGMALSNALVALAGALFAQTNGFADVTHRHRHDRRRPRRGDRRRDAAAARRPCSPPWSAASLGSVFYRIAVALALEADFLGLQASDLNLVTAVLVGARADPAGDARRGCWRGWRRRDDRARRASRSPSSAGTVAGDAGPARRRPRHPAGPVRHRDRQQRRRQVDAAERAGRDRARHGRAGSRSTAPTSRAHGGRRARAAARAGVPGPAGRHLRGADHRGEPGAGRGARAAARARRWRWPTPAGRAGASGWPTLGLGLEGRLGDRMGLLSGGQRQAVAC